MGKEVAFIVFIVLWSLIWGMWIGGSLCQSDLAKDIQEQGYIVLKGESYKTTPIEIEKVLVIKEEANNE